MLSTETQGPFESSPATHSRRSLLGAGATLALASAGFAGGTRIADAAFQIEATPPVVALPLIPQPSIAGKAAELGYDMDAIFRFVADEIAYEPYAGVLRGSRGTFWARAGNSADQALLLAALLDASQIPWRFAMGALDDEQAAILVDTMTIDAGTAIDRFADALLPAPSEPVQGDVADLDLPASELAFLENAGNAGGAMIEAGMALIDELSGMIADALEAGGVTLPEPGSALPPREREQHVWVQVADGPVWIDLDPTPPGAAPGAAWTTVVETTNLLPDELIHAATFVLEAETVSGGVAARSELIRQSRPVKDLVGMPVAVTNVDPGALEGLGLGITSVLEGRRQYVPYLLIGGEAHRGGLIGFNTGGAGIETIFGDEATLEGETLAEWIRVELSGPDTEPRIAERAIFDRIGFAARSAGEIDLTAIAPVEWTTDAETGDQAYLPAKRLISIATTAGALPYTYVGNADAADPPHGAAHRRQANRCSMTRRPAAAVLR